MRLAINLRLGNDAMSSQADAAAALRRLADRLEALDCFESLPLNIKDDNGNSVGECHLVASRRG